MRTFKSFAVVATALIALLSWSCELFEGQEQPKAPSITIGEPVFDTDAMTMTLIFTPSKGTTAWHYKVESEGAMKNFTFVAGDEPKEIVANIEFDVEYTVSAYKDVDVSMSIILFCSDICQKTFSVWEYCVGDILNSAVEGRICYVFLIDKIECCIDILKHKRDGAKYKDAFCYCESNTE